MHSLTHSKSLSDSYAPSLSHSQGCEGVACHEKWDKLFHYTLNPLRIDWVSAGSMLLSTTIQSSIHLFIFLQSLTVISSPHTCNWLLLAQCFKSIFWSGKADWVPNQSAFPVSVFPLRMKTSSDVTHWHTHTFRATLWIMIHLTCLI